MLLSYVLSFVYVGTYRNNRHHMLTAVRHVSGGALWVIPHLLMAAIAYWLLQQKLIALDRPAPARRTGALGRGRRIEERCTKPLRS